MTLQHPVNQAKGQGFFCSHKIISFTSSSYFFDALAGVFCHNAIHMKRLETIKARMNRILAENTGKSVDEVTAACERDNFMTAEEALAFGLVDRVLERH